MTHESELGRRDPSEEPHGPEPAECLSCYLERGLARFGCAGHRLTPRWAAGTRPGSGPVPSATDRGGLCCGVEVVFQRLSSVARQRRYGLVCDAAAARLLAGEVAPHQATTRCSGAGGTP